MKVPPRPAGLPPDTLDRLQRLLDEAKPFYKRGIRGAAKDLGVGILRLEKWLHRHSLDFRTLVLYSRWKIAKPLLDDPGFSLRDIKVRTGLFGKCLDEALQRFGRTMQSAAEHRQALGIRSRGPTLGLKIQRIPGSEIVSQVRELVRERPGESHAQVAAQMGCRGQRLTAWLARNGTNFRRLRTKVRVEIVETALTRWIAPSEIAKASGYLDVRSMIASMHKQKRPDLALRIRRWRPPTDFLLQVRQTIEKSPGLAMDEIASQVRCSKKKLNRLLYKDGTSFRRMRTEVRVELVERALRSRISFEEIARTCGYLNVPALKAGIYQQRPDLAARIRVLTKPDRRDALKSSSCNPSRNG